MPRLKMISQTTMRRAMKPMKNHDVRRRRRFWFSRVSAQLVEHNASPASIERPHTMQWPCGATGPGFSEAVTRPSLGLVLGTSADPDLRYSFVNHLQLGLKQGPALIQCLEAKALHEGVYARDYLSLVQLRWIGARPLI